MVVNKLFLFFAIFANLNSFAANSASNVETVDRHEEPTVKRNNLKELHGEYERVKREYGTGQESYFLNGFLENGTIPVNFPKDICLFEVNGVVHASALHFSNHPHSSVNQSTLLTIFKNVENGASFAEIFTYETKSAIDMDCLGIHGFGYVAIVNTIEHDAVDLSDGSPVFQVTSNSVNIVQYFSMPYQNKVYLKRHGNNLYFIQLLSSHSNKQSACPIFKWNRNHFDLFDELPCTNAMKMEPFEIESDVYVALANHKSELGESRITTNS